MPAITVKKRNRSGAANHIPRPPNSWILFRSSRAKKLRDEGVTLPRNAASQMFAEEWRSLSAAEKKPYEALAKQAKQDHEEAYPGYRYRPLTKAMKARMRDEGEVEDGGMHLEERQGQWELGQGQGQSVVNAFGADTPLGQPEPVLRAEHGIPFIPSNAFQGVVAANATFYENATGQYNGQGENALYQGSATHQGYYVPFNFPLPPVQGPNGHAQANLDLQQQLQALNIFFNNAGGSSGGSSSLGVNHHHHHHQQAAQGPPLTYYDAQALARYNLHETPSEPLQFEIGQTMGPAEVFDNFELWAWGGGDDGPEGGEGAALPGDLVEPSDNFIPTPSSSQTSTSPFGEGEFGQPPLYDISNVHDKGPASESSASLPVQGAADFPFDGVLDKSKPDGGDVATEGEGTPANGFRFEDWLDL